MSAHALCTCDVYVYEYASACECFLFITHINFICRETLASLPSYPIIYVSFVNNKSCECMCNMTVLYLSVLLIQGCGITSQAFPSS